MSTITKTIALSVVLAAGLTTAASAGNFARHHAPSMVVSTQSATAQSLPDNNGGELEMIRLQNMVSQRQMAVQLTANMLKALNGNGAGCEVCANIR